VSDVRGRFRALARRGGQMEPAPCTGAPQGASADGLAEKRAKRGGACVVSADIVPFGKYKGQPVESLLADQDYMRWLVAQIGLMRMLQDRFPAMFNNITIAAPATDDTIQRMIRSP
jgi:hypothetical protein